MKRSLVRPSQPAVPRDEDHQYGHQATRQWIMSHESPLFTSYLPTSHLCQFRQASLSPPSTYGLTWLYHIIILAVPSVCPVVLSSVQTRSPIINPSVYCPTLLHTACVEQVLHKYGWHGEHLSRWVGSRCRVSETERHTCWPGISREPHCCFMSRTLWDTLWDTHKHYGYQVDLELIPLTSEGLVRINYSFVLIL